MILSPKALAGFLELKLKEGNQSREYFLKGFDFEPSEVLVRIRMDTAVPGCFAISCEVQESKAVPDGLLSDFDLRCRLWLTSGDTGISSNVIFAVLSGPSSLMDAALLDTDIDNWPHDNSDLGRCIRLLERFPEWKSRLGEVVARFPGWGPMVAAWDHLETMYGLQVRDDAAGPGGEVGHTLYLLVKTLGDECMVAAGCVKTEFGWAWADKL